MKTAEELRDIPEAVSEPAPPRMVQRLSATPAAIKNAATAADPADDPGAVIIGIVAETSRAGGGPHSVTLTTGECIAVEREADLLELAKYVGTEYALRLTCVTGDDDQLYLQSFAIAD